MPNTDVNVATQTYAQMLQPYKAEIEIVHGAMSRIYIERIWTMEQKEGGLKFAVEVQESRTSPIRKSKWCDSPKEAYNEVFTLSRFVIDAQIIPA